jgi:hypothetical protein
MSKNKFNFYGKHTLVASRLYDVIFGLRTAPKRSRVSYLYSNLYLFLLV